MVKHEGKIILAPGLDVWPHELLTAKALAEAGHVVEFIPKSNVDRQKTADALIDGTRYEMKAPTSSHMPVVGKNIKKAMSQSHCIVFDSKRMKNVKDYQVLRELQKQLAENRKIKSLLFVDKKREVHRLK
ncbi:hypothetical protein [Adlercreutzia sp. ZJ473]|uniref:CdiA C-terminal domain-containing protein n=1 Tax=Adlercreutzia sp. ZJ473 TaxID=2722822 RepID=UPI0015542DCB|nr:hypothetical protein [Adlercreutzia sp. ZJ473]